MQSGSKRFRTVENGATATFTVRVPDIDPCEPIAGQICRRALKYVQGLSGDNERNEILQLLEWNSSLGVWFQWSFRQDEFSKILSECEASVKPEFTGNIASVYSDNSCSWIGFLQFDTFDRLYYQDLCIEDLIDFNNRLIRYQTAVVEFITSHPLYKQYGIVYNDTYRYRHFKQLRKDPVALSGAFQYYIDSLLQIGFAKVSVDTIDVDIGCHYLYHPDVYFELLDFNKLKGTVSE